MTSLDTALTAYIWADGSAVPGRHPESVPDRALRDRVEGLIERMDVARRRRGAMEVGHHDASRDSSDEKAVG